MLFVSVLDSLRRDLSSVHSIAEDRHALLQLLNKYRNKGFVTPIMEVLLSEVDIYTLALVIGEYGDEEYIRLFLNTNPNEISTGLLYIGLVRSDMGVLATLLDTGSHAYTVLIHYLVDNDYFDTLNRLRDVAGIQSNDLIFQL